MTKKISSVAEVISDKIVGNMIIAKYFCQRTVKLQNVWGIFIKYSVDNLQHHFQDTLGWQRGYFALAWENGNSNAIQLLGSAVLNARYWLVKAAMVHILLLVRLQLWPKPCFWQSQYSWCLGLGCSCSWDGINCHSCFYPNSLSKHSWQYGFSPCSLNVPLFSCFRQKLKQGTW